MSPEIATDHASSDTPNLRKRKANTKISGKELKVARKRVQNRLSQQSSREKQAAYIQQLESIVQLIKTKAEENDEGNIYSKTLGAHTKLLKEKLELEESLFRFRRKLFSVGHMATAAVDDKGFNTLKPTSLRRSRGLSSPETVTEHVVQAVTDALNSLTSHVKPAQSYTTSDGNIDLSSFVEGIVCADKGTTWLDEVDT